MTRRSPSARWRTRTTRSPSAPTPPASSTATSSRPRLPAAPGTSTRTTAPPRATSSTRPKRGRRQMRVLKLLATAGLLVLLAIAVLILVPPLLGYQRYVITGGSMGGALPRGSIAYDEVVPTEHIRVGDVITYRPPKGDRLLTHRGAWQERPRP